MCLFFSHKTILLNMKHTQSGVLIEKGYSSGIRNPMLYPFSDLQWGGINHLKKSLDFF